MKDGYKVSYLIVSSRHSVERSVRSGKSLGWGYRLMGDWHMLGKEPGQYMR